MPRPLLILLDYCTILRPKAKHQEEKQGVIACSVLGFLTTWPSTHIGIKKEIPDHSQQASLPHILAALLTSQKLDRDMMG